MELDDKLCAHYLNLNFSENFLSDEDINLHFELPYPISRPLKDSEIDVISQFEQDVVDYKHRLATVRKEFQLVREKIMKQSFTDSHVIITKDLLNFCNSKKYETPFTCDYNPYYATGVLEHFSLGNCNYLVRPDCANNLRITDIANPWRSHKLHLEYEISEDITGISTYKNGDLFLLLRHGKGTNLVKIRDINESAEMKWTKKFKHRLLDSKFNETKVGIVTSDTKFRLYDTETSTRVDLESYNIGAATRFEFISPNTVLLLDQKTLKTVDLRSTGHKLFQPTLNNCDSLCSAGINNNLIYLTTRHYLIRTDVRFVKNVEFCTHLMKYSPCYMDLVDNFLCLSSQRFQEKVLFTGEPINTLPTNVPSISDTLNKCRLQKDILLRPEIDKRLQKSVGGVKLVDMFLYTVNSLGDIFRQKITNNSQIDESGPIESLYRWVNKLPEREKPLHLTGVVNASDARFVLNKRIQSENLLKFTRKSKKVDYFLNHYNSVYKNNLGELATNFVSIWNEDEEEEREEVDLVPEVAPIDKVSKWIESSFFD